MFSLARHSRPERRSSQFGHAPKLTLRRATCCIAAALTAALAAHPAACQTPTSPTALPQLAQRGPATQFLVDGKPFLILGGELHNSSSSSVEYMQPIWPQLAAMHLNTVLLPVAWETIEPQEGHFDFRCVDGLLQGARQNHLKLIILWFGSWKNTYSSYTPAWVKTDLQRFPRVQTSDGRSTERLSTFSTAGRDADADAFAALMRHLRQVDSAQHTVLMVQVENEVGVIPQSRDHSPAANAAFAAPVPAPLMNYLEAHRATLDPQLRSAWDTAGGHAQGTWQQVFGSGPLTSDFFMAWQFATYIQHVAAAGKAEDPLPMYANAALIRPNYGPGQYNSGGPLPQSIDIWRAGAPALNLLAPDIYFNNFAFWAGQYARPGNPLFIPETFPGEAGAANALYAFGHLSAIGFSPFGIDGPSHPPPNPTAANASTEAASSAASAAAASSPIAGVYAELSHLAPMILEKQSTGGITAALVEGEAQRAARVRIGDYTATITRAASPFAAGPATASPFPADDRVGVMFLQTAPNEFLVLGAGDAQITFSTDQPGPPTVGIESIDEEFFEHGAWVPRRRLNGDENSQGQALRIHATDLAQGRIYRLRLYRYR